MTSPNRLRTPELLLELLRSPSAQDDKYSRGVVGFATGSARYPGAALLGITAAARAGAGMIRVSTDESVLALVLEARPECVPVGSVTEPERCNAWVIGSGIGADDHAAGERLNALVSALQAQTPIVIDAGALDLLDRRAMAGRRILTPHAGEAVRLLDRFGVKTTRTEVEGDLVGAAQQLANLTGAIVLLKAARTVVAAPGDISSRSDEAPHELATAGTGDVLAGLLGALLAKAGESADLFEIAKAGVWLHSEAARELAAGGNFAALDLANQLRSTILGLVNDGQ